jgi:hypothetical protein
MAILVVASGSQSKNFWNDPPMGCPKADRTGWMRGMDAKEKEVIGPAGLARLRCRERAGGRPEDQENSWVTQNGLILKSFDMG